MTYKVRLTREAVNDLDRRYDFLLERDVDAAERAVAAIEHALTLLSFSPFSCRKAFLRRIRNAAKSVCGQFDSALVEEKLRWNECFKSKRNERCRQRAQGSKGRLISQMLFGLLLIVAPLIEALGQDAQPGATVASTGALRDGRHDFDFEFGRWHTHLKRLLKPLTGSTTWVEYDGTTTVSPVWGGRANLLELKVDGSNCHIEALSLRLYNPDSHQWSLNFSNSASGSLGTPTIGEFKNGRGEFFDQETLGPRTILVRFIVAPISTTEVHFEQSFSDDGGKTWEVNWIAIDTRIHQ